ncbi:MAG: hypothetical protein GX237_06800 [Clostridiales bacterium]|nr:hypothetical protein [Clostridiales bacterium]
MVQAYKSRYIEKRCIMGKSNCEYCSNYQYDEEYGYYVCLVNLDEDEMYRFLKGSFGNCPHFSYGDEYKIVRKQM